MQAYPLIPVLSKLQNHQVVEALQLSCLVPRYLAQQLLLSYHPWRGWRLLQILEFQSLPPQLHIADHMHWEQQEYGGNSEEQQINYLPPFETFSPTKVCFPFFLNRIIEQRSKNVTAIKMPKLGSIANYILTVALHVPYAWFIWLI